MRLWHKDLIPALPRKQLLGQWRECCAIARNISEKGSPNHVLVNRIMDYPMYHFYQYGVLVHLEMTRRNYRCDFDRFAKYFTFPHETYFVDMKNIFPDWHNDRYLRQCYYNLEEKYDCGAITRMEFENILTKVDI